MLTAETSKSTIREAARAFAHRWLGTSREQAEKQTFWNEFLGVFGIDRRQVAAFEALASRASTGNIGWVDLLYPNQMAVEHKSAGEDLDQAMDQLFDYLPRLVHASITPWLLVTCDFNHFKWRNLVDNTSGDFDLAALPENIHLFWWMAGHESPIEAFESEEDCNQKATDIMAVLHDSLRDAGYPEADRRAWLTRILFCMFADDTDVWDRAAFHAFIAHQTREDGSDLGSRLAEVFQVLDTPEDSRSSLLSEELRIFTYINGDLFSDQIRIPACNDAIRSALLTACRFNWAAISPAIFGSMFQSVMLDQERRAIGAHYTEEDKIIRVIRPLFLDELEAELNSCVTLSSLRQFHEKLSSLTFFDPACGCGNFLVIAYREIRRLESVVIGRIQDREVNEARTRKRERLSPGQLGVNLELLCKVSVNQFYGIEIEEFPARIARTALYLIDHIANRQVSAQFGQHFVRFPIPASSTIVIGNALRIDWANVLAPEDACYLLGNPPFIGISLRSDQQTDDLKHVWGNSYHGTLDYVTGWYKKAVAYIGREPIKAAFVSTNSICQGEQVSPLWSFILGQGFKIDFAHRTFKWSSQARGTASVHCVIIGFSRNEITSRKLIFDYPDITGDPVQIEATNINPYLLDYENIIVAPASNPISDQLVEVRYGNKPTDGGFLIVNPDEHQAFMADPVASQYVRKYVGARELLHGTDRWCLWLLNAPPGEVRRSTLLTQRVAAVRAFRLASDASSTNQAAETASLFRQIVQPNGNYLCIPIHVSESRTYFPTAYYSRDVIASNATFVADDPDGFIFSILSSSMFISWFRAVGGKIKSDLRFNKLLVYNTFPMPHLSDRRRGEIIDAGRLILQARERYANSTLAQLYDLDMRPDLLEAHRALDRAVDRALGVTSMPATEYSRLRRLFELYRDATSPLQAATVRHRARRSRQST